MPNRLIWVLLSLFLLAVPMLVYTFVPKAAPVDSEVSNDPTGRMGSMAMNYRPWNDSTPSLSDEDSLECESIIKAYYRAVVMGDLDAQRSYWAPNVQDEARRESQKWANRNTEGLYLTAFHSEATDDPATGYGHYYLWTKGKNQPEGKAALMGKVDGKWRIKKII